MVVWGEGGWMLGSKYTCIGGERGGHWGQMI